jgi:exo-beta-1,3-glucanase (GH17 family)
MRERRFVSYQPTAITFVDGKATKADEASIAADLKSLRPWFDAIVTYSSANGAERVVDVAATLGYRAVIAGIWDISDWQEVENALAAVARNPALVVGLGVGNEPVFSGRADWATVARALSAVRAAAPRLPLATTEPFAKYLDDRESQRALAQMDFMLVNVHPIFEPWFRKSSADNWSAFVLSVLGRLHGAFAGPIVVKETGVPSGPASAGYNETMQHDFWRALESRFHHSQRSTFSYFTAFDSPWRAYDATPGASGPRPEEAHWGLLTQARMPKRVMTDFPPLS